jgi:hypothetical protein
LFAISFLILDTDVDIDFTVHFFCFNCAIGYHPVRIHCCCGEICESEIHFRLRIDSKKNNYKRLRLRHRVRVATPNSIWLTLFWSGLW